VTAKGVVVDANRRWAGHTLEMEVELIAVRPREQQAHPGDGPCGAVRAGWAVAFDLGAGALANLREALPGWEISVINGASADSLRHDRALGAADLFLVGIDEHRPDALGLCRLLARRSAEVEGHRQGIAEALGTAGGAVRQQGPPLVVLLAPEQGALVAAALDAGARNCLVLPVSTKDLAAVARPRPGSRPAPSPPRAAQAEDLWREVGGEG
jgi:hypothetical protein